ncbi:MAG: CU044_5270 family protein [Actinomycetota bacterium]
MDDLDLVKRFREGVPEPGLSITHAAHAAMTAGRAPGRVVTMRPRRPRIRWRVGIGVAAAAVAIAIALPAILPGGGPGGAEPAAAAALHRAALAAARQPAAPTPRAGQFVYTRSTAVNIGMWAPGDGHEAFSVIQPLTREAWIGPDGSGRLLQTNGTASFPTPADEAAWTAAGSPDLRDGATSDDSFAAGGLYFMDLSGLPTDPEALFQVIEDRAIVGGPPGDAETFTLIGDLLRETYASPALRAALYEVAAGLSGVELVGNTTDASGRPGVAVAYRHDGTRNELIFDPETAVMLGESTVVTEAGAMGLPVGTVISSAVYLASGVVDSTYDTI